MWREFPFFELTPIRDPYPPAEPLYSDPELLTIAPGIDTVFYSTREGWIKEFDEKLLLVRAFQACDASWAIMFLKVLSGPRVLVSAATKQNEPVKLVVWDLAGPKASIPKVISTIDVVNGSNTFPPTGISLASDASVIACGFADGAVIVVRGDIVHDRGSRQRHVYTASSAVTGLELVEPSPGNVIVYVTSLTQTVTVSTSGMSLINKPLRVLEMVEGAAYGCTTQYNGDLIVAREDKVTYYTPLHRGPAFTFDMPKRSVSTYKQYIVLTTVWAQQQSVLSTESVRVTIIDSKNDFIAFNGHVALGIKATFTLWNRVNVLGSDGVLYVLKEKPLDSQLAILTTQHLYPSAIKVAENSGADRREIMKLHQEYGNFLNERDDPEGALEQYVASMDLGNTSQVVLRYKRAQNLPVLAKYLEALYKQQAATPQHLTLLTVCYANLGHIDKLKTFLATVVEDPGFDFATAIEVCRNAKLYALAAFVAEKWPDPDLVVQIRLRDLSDYKGCLDYIVTVSVSDALRILSQNSRILLNNLPVETTGVLITLFTGKFVPKAAQNDAESVSISDKNTTDKSESFAAPVLQSYQAFIKYISSANYLGAYLVDARSLEDLADAPSYQPPRPRLIFPSFIGHDNEFVIFLEACLSSASQFQPSDKDLRDIVTTLYEIYLKLANAETKSRAHWTDKAASLITEHGDMLDRSRILVIAKVANVQLETSQLIALGASYTELFERYMDQGDYQKACDLLGDVQDGPSRKQLVPLALTRLTASESALANIRPTLTKLLEECVEKHYLTVLQLVKLLCNSPYVTIGDLRPFLSQFIEKEQAAISYNEKIVSSYEGEIKEKQKELNILTNDPVVLQYHDCSLCRGHLDLPAVHFACKHSYHERCVSTNIQCPLCLPETDNIEMLRKSQVETAAKEDMFQDALSSHTDKMKVIDDFISRGGLIPK